MEDVIRVWGRSSLLQSENNITKNNSRTVDNVLGSSLWGCNFFEKKAHKITIYSKLVLIPELSFLVFFIEVSKYSIFNYNY
jgi:hypothetical protein